ncbi:MAG: glycosyltransferase family 4 protein [Parachlamydiaceae bacterium]|nr:glycosyltransferase family 4 protein [Parachlamydiaceae bacterium]
MLQNEGRIYYFCPSYSRPIGGLKKIYQHVDILNAAGIPSYVVHSEMGFRCDWFENKTPVAYIEAANDPLLVLNDEGDESYLPPFSAYDILVLPELMAYQIAPHTIALGQYIVIFNQNAYLTFQPVKLPTVPFTALRENEDKTPYYNSNLLGTIVVSEDLVEFLEYAFPGLALYHVHITIDFSLFQYSKEKKKQIAYMPRKHKNQNTQLVNILKERNNLSGWTFVPIDNVSEQEVARILQDSALFLSFSEEEGFGLPPFEAMACGCIVIGYHGQGGKEFLIPPYAYPINDGEVLLFAQTVEKIVLDYNKNEKFYQDQAQKASEFIYKNYSQRREEEELKAIWLQIIEKHQKALAAL